jgi:presenilin-like A22 family membrane protease
VITLKTVFTIVTIYLLTQLIGLYVGYQYLGGIESGDFVSTFENPDNINNSLMLFVYIIVSTAGILVVVKFWKPSIRVLEALVVFLSSWITFDFIIPIGIWIFSLGFLMAIALTIWKALRPTVLNQNVAAIFSGAGAGGLLGASFGFVPSLVFLVLLCIYDFVSVFITKHMISLAKELTKRPMAFTIASPHKFKKAKFVGISKTKKKIHVFQLGVGDIVIPLMFSISLLRNLTIINSLFSILGSTIALILLIYYMTKKPMPLPALPFITVGTLSGFLISILL